MSAQADSANATPMITTAVLFIVRPPKYRAGCKLRQAFAAVSNDRAPAGIDASRCLIGHTPIAVPASREGYRRRFRRQGRKVAGYRACSGVHGAFRMQPANRLAGAMIRADGAPDPVRSTLFKSEHPRPARLAPAGPFVWEWHILAGAPLACRSRARAAPASLRLLAPIGPAGESRGAFFRRPSPKQQADGPVEFMLSGTFTRDCDRANDDDDARLRGQALDHRGGDHRGRGWRFRL